MTCYDPFCRLEEVATYHAATSLNGVPDSDDSIKAKAVAEKEAQCEQLCCKNPAFFFPPEDF